MAAQQRPNTPIESNLESGNTSFSNNDEEFKTLDDAYSKLRSLFTKKVIEPIIASINLYSASLSQLGIEAAESNSRKNSYTKSTSTLDTLRSTLNRPQQADFDAAIAFINKKINEKERKKFLQNFSNLFGGRRRRRTTRRTRRRKTYK